MQRISKFLTQALIPVAIGLCLALSPDSSAAAPTLQFGAQNSPAPATPAAGNSNRASRRAAAASGARTLTIQSVNAGSLALPDVQRFRGGNLRDQQPLGLDGAILTEKCEVFYALPGTSEAPAASWMAEDLTSNSAVIPGTGNLTDYTRAAARGNLDSDPEQELVTVEFLSGPNNMVRLWRVDHMPDGSYWWSTWMDVPRVGSGADYYPNASIELGDFDGDQRDEVVLVLSTKPFNEPGNKSWIRVFDDPGDGGGLMLDYERTANHASMWGLPADLDGDGIDELVLALEGDTTSPDRFAVRVYRGGAGANALQLEMNYAYLSIPNLSGIEDVFAGRAVVGDFDGDGADEIAYVGLQGFNSHAISPPYPVDIYMAMEFRIRLFDYSAETGLSVPRELEHPLGYSIWRNPYGANGWSWDLAAVDRFGARKDEIAILHSGMLYCELLLVDYDATNMAWNTEEETMNSHSFSKVAASLAAEDGDGDGAQELYAGITIRNWGPPVWSNSTLYGVIALDGGGHVTQSWNQTAQYTQSSPLPPVIVPAELDGDGFVLRYTGQRGVSVSDPIPLVLLTAAPTKAGITQNYDNTSTAYSIGSGSGVSIGVSSGAAWGVSAGAELPLGLGGSAKVSVEKALNRSQTESEQVTYVVDYTGAYDNDTIIFQANRYDTFRYEVVSSEDPADIGQFVTLAVPVGANAYKWTVDFYNATVAPEFRIGADLLPHTIGDPDSYRRLAQLQPLLNRYVSWKSPTMQTVGQGSSTSGLSISLENEGATEEERSLTLGAEAEFSAGVSVGVSHAATESELYSISISESTTYATEVGDISNVVDYQGWDYKFGLAVYQAGRLDDGNGNLSWEVGARPLTVVTFWIETLGLNY